MKRRTNPKELPTVSLLNQWQDCMAPAGSLKERIDRGKEFRKKRSRASHGNWKAPDSRPNPLDLLRTEGKAKYQPLLPLKYGRMAQSPFAFYRGAALLMAEDLSYVPRTDLFVQLCGDCHLSNFGLFATPERNVIFDLNDFDETLPGPFEWDLKRLAASFAIAADNNGFKKSVAENCILSMSKMYRRKMEEFAFMTPLDVWYHRVDVEYLARTIKQPGRKQTAMMSLARLKEKRGHAGAVAKLTEVVDGNRRIKDVPPLIFHLKDLEVDNIRQTLQEYATTLWQSRQRLLHRYHFVDVAAKVVGVGSIGSVALINLLQGEGDAEDFIILQTKEAAPSVLERYIGKSEFAHPGERIVNGQRVLQAASDLFLGWTTGHGAARRKFYFRQLMDMKQSIPIEELDAISLEQYAEVCAYVLARAHARTGDPAMLHGYIGKSDEFDEALAKFAFTYQKQNEKDHGALGRAIQKGEIKAQFLD